jgi:hypothetical protein
MIKNQQKDSGQINNNWIYGDPTMKKSRICCALSACMYTFYATCVSAATIYEWQSQGSTIGYLSLKDSIASYNSAWSVASGESFIDQVEGELSGISVFAPAINDFVSPVSGDLTVVNDFGSNSGSELDFGYLSGSLIFANGSIWSDLTFNLSPLQDAFTFDDAGDGIGNPSATFGYAVASVPVPAAIWLFGSGLLGLIGVARCKKA